MKQTDRTDGQECPSLMSVPQQILILRQHVIVEADFIVRIADVGKQFSDDSVEVNLPHRIEVVFAVATGFNQTGDAQQREVMADRQTAWTIRSKTPLTMQERSEYRFQLREEASGNGKVLIRRLPVASAEHIGVDQSGNRATLVSEMYVNS